MTEIINRALQEGWTCEQVAQALEEIGLSREQIAGVMNGRIVKS